MASLFELAVDITRGYNKMLQATRNIRMCQWPFTGKEGCGSMAEYYVDGQELCDEHMKLAYRANPGHTHIEKIPNKTEASDEL